MQHFFHVLEKFTDDELTHLCNLLEDEAGRGAGFGDEDATNRLSTSRTPCNSDNFSMKEVQIHGPIRFADDVDALVLSERHAYSFELLEKVQRFCDSNGITMGFQKVKVGGHVV